MILRKLGSLRGILFFAGSRSFSGGEIYVLRMYLNTDNVILCRNRRFSGGEIYVLGMYLNVIIKFLCQEEENIQPGGDIHVLKMYFLMILSFAY